MKSLSIALAYVGIVVGAGLSSGQDILQYFLSFGLSGIAAMVLLGLLNLFYGKVMLALGSYYQSDNHDEVLRRITHPFVGRLIDVTLVLSGFVIGFVMIAGAGANLHQQFGLPIWSGAALCSVLMIIVSFLDFEKITHILGVFTPIILVMLLIIMLYTLAKRPYSLAEIKAAAATLIPAVASPWVSAINYFALCMLTGASMAFVLGGSIVRISQAEKSGALGGFLVGLIILMAGLTLFAWLPLAKKADVPMLAIVSQMSPLFAFFYALTIFALIFNTAFALFYATARRFAGSQKKKTRWWFIGLTLSGFGCSFMGFKALIALLYPLLGYMGILLLLAVTLAYLKEQRAMGVEKKIRRAMIHLAVCRYDDNRTCTKKDWKRFAILGSRSKANTETIEKGVTEYVKEALDGAPQGGR